MVARSRPRGDALPRRRAGAELSPGGSRAPFRPVARIPARVAPGVPAPTGRALAIGMEDPGNEIYERVASLLDEVDARLDEGHADEGLELALQAQKLLE